MNLNELRNDCSLKQKKGVAFYYCFHNYMDGCFMCSPYTDAYINEEPHYLLLHSPIDAVIIFDFQNNKG